MQARDVQRAALCFLFSVAAHEDAKQRVGKCGGVERILQAMTIHSTCSRTVHAALAALCRLANKSRTNQDRMVGSGALPAIVTAMVRMH
jgi:hypothetical protein